MQHTIHITLDPKHGCLVTRCGTRQRYNTESIRWTTDLHESPHAANVVAERFDARIISVDHDGPRITLTVEGN